MKKTTKIFSTLFAASLTLGLLVVGSNSSNSAKAEKPAAAAEGEYVMTARELMAGLSSYTVGDVYLESNATDGEYMVFDCRNLGTENITPRLHFESGTVANNTWKELSKRATSIDFKFRITHNRGGLTNCMLFVDGYAPNFTASKWFTMAENVWNDSSTTGSSLTFTRPADDANPLRALVLNGAVAPGKGCCIEIKEVVFSGINNAEVAFSNDLMASWNNVNGGVLMTLKSAHGGTGNVNYALGTEDHIKFNGMSLQDANVKLRTDHENGYVWFTYADSAIAGNVGVIEILKPTFFCNVLLPKACFILGGDGKWYYNGEEYADRPTGDHSLVSKKDSEPAYVQDADYENAHVVAKGQAPSNDVEFSLKINPITVAKVDMHVRVDVANDSIYGGKSGYLVRINTSNNSLLLVEKASVVLAQKTGYTYPSGEMEVTLSCYELSASKHYIEVKINGQRVLSHVRHTSSDIFYGKDFSAITNDDCNQHIASSTTYEAAALNAFIDKNMHMSDYNDQLGWCKDVAHNYYGVAKAYYNAYLTANQKALFMSDADYEAAKARLVAWASANGEVISGTSFVKNVMPFEVLSLEESNIPTMIAVMSIVTALSFAALIIIKKKKHN